MKLQKTREYLYVGNASSKTQLSPNCDLPKLLKDIPLPNQPTVFTRHDIHNVLSQILKKGQKYQQYKQQLDRQDASILQTRILNSTFVTFALLKEMNLMGDDRRLGNNLRGFSKILLDELQEKIFKMIKLQIHLFVKSIEETDQIQQIKQLIMNAPAVV